MDEAAREHFEKVERGLAQHSSKSIHDPKIFGKLLVASDVEARLHGSSFLKLKLNWDRVRFWDVEGQPIEDPGTCPAAGAPCRGAAPSLADERPVRAPAGGPRRAAAGARANPGGLPVLRRRAKRQVAPGGTRRTAGRQVCQN